MDTKQKMEVDMTDCIKDSGLTVELTVTGVKWWKFRCHLGLAIIRFGAWIAGLRSAIAKNPSE
jgi:hypothetical protein